MKNVYLFFLLIISIGSVSAWSYDSSYNYGDASAYAKISSSDIQCEGSKSNDLCAGKWYIDVSHSGDKFYIGYRQTSWAKATESGITGLQEISDGRIYPNEDGKFPYYILCAWDYDIADNEDWAWSSKCGGYLGDNYFSYKSVDCITKSDCNAGYLCSANICKKDPCYNIDCSDKCVGNNFTSLGTCSNGLCSYKNNAIVLGKCGIECLNETKCINNNYFECSSHKFKNMGIVKDKCNVKCIKDTDCYSNFSSQSSCIDGKIIKINENIKCESYNCKYTQSEDILNNCYFGCADSSTCNETKYKYYGIGAIALLILLSLIFIIGRRK